MKKEGLTKEAIVLSRTIRPSALAAEKTHTSQIKLGLVRSSLMLGQKSPTSRIKQGEHPSELESRYGHPGTDSSRCSGAVLMQYVVPVAIPAVAAILLTPFVEGDRSLGGLTISASRPAALTR